MSERIKEPYFVRDRDFYRSLFHILIIVALQGFLNYSVNMADNMMLGRYGQTELSGVACVSQIFFVLNALYQNLGSAFSVLAAQYWGQKRIDRINGLGAVLLKVNLVIGLLFFILSAVIPTQLVSIFVSDPDIIAKGVIYLGILKWTFIPYGISFMIMDILRNVETVAIAFYMSIVSLVINVFFNYLLIFGSLGCPEMGVAGAAVATLIARLVEVAVLIFYLAVIDPLSGRAVVKAMRGCQNKVWRNQSACAKAATVNVEPAHSLPTARLIAGVQACQARVLRREARRHDPQKRDTNSYRTGQAALHGFSFKWFERNRRRIRQKWVML